MGIFHCARRLKFYIRLFAEFMLHVTFAIFTIYQSSKTTVASKLLLDGAIVLKHRAEEQIEILPFSSMTSVEGIGCIVNNLFQNTSLKLIIMSKCS